jgi:hypothetical protein
MHSTSLTYIAILGVLPIILGSCTETSVQPEIQTQMETPVQTKSLLQIKAETGTQTETWIHRQQIEYVWNNLWVFEDGKNINTLTTRWNSKPKACDFSQDPEHFVCIYYTIVQSQGKYGVVLKWTERDGTENGWPNVFLYNFSNAQGNLTDITSDFDKKYHIKNLGTYNLIKTEVGILLETTITRERLMSPEEAQKLGYVLKKIWWTEEYPIYKASLQLPEEFFQQFL